MSRAIDYGRFFFNGDYVASFFFFFFNKYLCQVTLTFFVLLARWLRVFAYGKVLWAGAVFCVCMFVCMWCMFIVA